MDNHNQDQEKRYNLESKLKRLEEIARKIQNPNVGIDDALKLYQEGIELSQKCKKIILSIETKIEELSKVKVREKSS